MVRANRISFFVNDRELSALDSYIHTLDSQGKDVDRSKVLRQLIRNLPTYQPRQEPPITIRHLNDA